MNTSANLKIVTKFWSKKIIKQIKNILVMPSFQTLHINRYAKVIFKKKMIAYCQRFVIILTSIKKSLSDLLHLKF